MNDLRGEPQALVDVGPQTCRRRPVFQRPPEKPARRDTGAMFVGSRLARLMSGALGNGNRAKHEGVWPECSNVRFWHLADIGPLIPQAISGGMTG